MAASDWWVKVRIDLNEEPEVLAMARTLGVEPDLVVGKLVAVWGWARRKGRKGVVVGVAVTDVSRLVRMDGFGESMVAEGWLCEECHAGVTQLVFPDFAKYCPQTERCQALAAERQRKRRSRSRHAPVTLPSRDGHADVTPCHAPNREEKNTEEKNPPTPQRGDGGAEGSARTYQSAFDIPIPTVLDTPDFRARWALYLRHLAEKRRPISTLAAQEQLRRLSEIGPARAVAAIDYSIAQNWDSIHEPPPPKPGEKNEATERARLEQERRDMDEKTRRVRERARRKDEPPATLGEIFGGGDA